MMGENLCLRLDINLQNKIWNAIARPMIVEEPMENGLAMVSLLISISQ